MPSLVDEMSMRITSVTVWPPTCLPTEFCRVYATKCPLLSVTNKTSLYVCTWSHCRQGCLKRGFRGCFGPGMIVRTLVRFTSAKLLVQKWASLNGLASVGLFGDKLASLRLVVISLSVATTTLKHVLNMLWVTVGG